jgi:hypothetical protein
MDASKIEKPRKTQQPQQEQLFVKAQGTRDK